MSWLPCAAADHVHHDLAATWLAASGRRRGSIEFADCL
jgi:hypothetical protein